MYADTKTAMAIAMVKSYGIHIQMQRGTMIPMRRKMVAIKERMCHSWSFRTRGFRSPANDSLTSSWTLVR